MDLEFDTETLRIRDLAEEEQSSNYGSSGNRAANGVLDSIKTKSSLNVDRDGVITTDNATPAPKAQIMAGKLSSMLKNLNDDW